MPLSLGDLRSRTRRVAVPVAGETLEVEYRPTALTPGLIAWLRGIEADGQPERLAEVLCQVVIGWDLLGDDGAPLPVTEEVARELPLRLLGVIVRAVLEDAQEDPPSPGTSAAGSAPRGSSAAPRSGTR